MPKLIEMFRGGGFQDYFSDTIAGVVPDLSLHISPPNSTPSSTSTEKDSSTNFNIWRRFDSPSSGCALKSSHSNSSIVKEAHPELSLARNNSLWSLRVGELVEIVGQARCHWVLEREKPYQPPWDQFSAGFIGEVAAHHRDSNVPQQQRLVKQQHLVPVPSLSPDHNDYFPRSSPIFSNPSTGPTIGNGMKMVENIAQTQQHLQYYGGSFDFSELQL